MDVVDLRARSARRQRRKALRRHVHGVDAARAAHQHGERQRLAARARAIVGDHLAAPRGKQVRKQLAALVLHFDQAVAKKRMLVDRRLAGEPHSRRRVRGWRRFDAIVREPREYLFPARAREVHAQIERRGIEEALRDAHRLVAALLGFEPLPQPVGQIRAHRIGQRLARGRADSPHELGIDQALERAAREAEHAHHSRHQQRRRLGSAGGRFERAAPAQHRKRRLGNESARFLPELAMAAEVMRQRLVGGRGKAQQIVERRAGMPGERRIGRRERQGYRLGSLSRRQWYVSAADRAALRRARRNGWCRKCRRRRRCGSAAIARAGCSRRESPIAARRRT